MIANQIAPAVSYTWVKTTLEGQVLLSERIMQGFRLTALKLGTAVVGTLLLGGCQDKLTYEHFTQIREDVSTRPIVTELIGKPDENLGDRWSYERPKEHLFVFIDFGEDGYVTRKQWIDAMSATWEDSPSTEGDPSSRESIHIDRGRE